MSRHRSTRADRRAAVHATPESAQSLTPPRAVVLEVRSAMGGEDAAVFAGELIRAYLRYAERRGWGVEILDGDMLGAGTRNATLRLEGPGVHGLLGEAGTHRVQRQPANDRSGRRHTSAATVAVLPVRPADVEQIDLRHVEIQAFRSSGAGGQNVQKTETAIRAIHRPTGLTAVVQDERSQYSNKARALELLAARVSARTQAAVTAGVADMRRRMVGSGHIAERVRTYAWRDGTVTDHRLGLSAPLSEFMRGDLDVFMSA